MRPRRERGRASRCRAAALTRWRAVALERKARRATRAKRAAAHCAAAQLIAATHSAAAAPTRAAYWPPGGCHASAARGGARTHPRCATQGARKGGGRTSATGRSLRGAAPHEHTGAATGRARITRACTRGARCATRGPAVATQRHALRAILFCAPRHRRLSMHRCADRRTKTVSRTRARMAVYTVGIYCRQGGRGDERKRSNQA